jgi:hypothetical protein
MGDKNTFQILDSRILWIQKKPTGKYPVGFA